MLLNCWPLSCLYFISENKNRSSKEGNASGCVRIFGLVGEQQELMFIDRKQEHSEAITDLATYDEWLASADEGGRIVLWILSGEELVKTHHLPLYGSACTSVKLHEGLLLAAYGSGHLRLFSLATTPPSLLCEVAAHARWITSLDLAAHSSPILALSVAEDSFVRIWEIVPGDRCTVMKQKFYTQVEDSFLVGGRFLTSNATAFCVSAYDSNLVHCFKY